MKRVGLYVRVSTQEQNKHGLSVDTQIKALNEYCISNGFEVFKIYNDAGHSARKSYKKRPALQELIIDCNAGLIDLILVTRLDRFFRSVPDYYDFIKQIKVPWRSIWEEHETETPDGVFKLNIWLSIAQAEADKTSMRIKDVYSMKRARGDYIGLAPVGYKKVNNQLIKDEEKEKAVSEMFKTYLQTFSPTKAIQVAKLYGFDTNFPNFHKIIKNPCYAGNTRQGYKCEPYITEKEHDIIMARSNSREPKYGDRVYLFQGLLRCSMCGRKLHAHVSTNKGNGFLKRYECNGNRQVNNRCLKHNQIGEKRMEKILIDNLDTMLSNALIEASYSAKGADGYIKQKERLEGKIERLKELYIDGLIEKEDFQRRIADTKRELSNLKPPQAISVNLPNDWLSIYKQLDDSHKKSFWEEIIVSITVDPVEKEKIKIQFR